MFSANGKSCLSVEEGFTLIELLMTVALSVIVVSALFFSANECQKLGRDFHELTIRNQNVVLASLLLIKLIPSAGNALSSKTDPFFKAGDSSLRWSQDIDGEEGFPNGSLTESYEECGIRKSEEYLQLRSGAGYYQSFVRRISDFQVSHQDRDLSLAIEGKTKRLMTSRRSVPLRVDCRIHIWNGRTNLFAREDE